MATKENPQPAVVAVLLDAGADPTLIDKAGKTAWDYAQDNPQLKNTTAHWRINISWFNDLWQLVPRKFPL